MKALKKFALLLIFTLAFAACSDITNEPSDMDAASKNNPASGTTIYDIASSNADFSILAAAVDAAGFEGLLDGNRIFTVFAPTNAAFTALLADLGLTAEQLLGNTELLKSVLSYHVSPGLKKSPKVLYSGKVNTLEGSFIYSKVENDVPMVGNDNGYANILTADVKASNGVIHIIDAVLLP